MGRQIQYSISSHFQKIQIEKNLKTYSMNVDGMYNRESHFLSLNSDWLTHQQTMACLYIMVSIAMDGGCPHVSWMKRELNLAQLKQAVTTSPLSSNIVTPSYILTKKNTA